MNAAQQMSSVASSAFPCDDDELLSPQMTDLEVIRAVTSAIPADQRAKVLLALAAFCA
jgi:hypothetical protein